MSILQLIFDRASAAHGDTRVWRRLRELAVRCGDPLVQYDIGGRTIALNMSHRLPLYRNMFPTYGANLTRLADAIRASDGGLRMIDVGANVGDSFFLVDPRPTDRFLLIEGDPEYFRLLTRNTHDEPGVRCVLALLSDNVDQVQGRLSAKDGTGRIVAAASAASSGRYRTLDQVVTEHFDVTPNLLKTDVDGYDTKIIRGGLDLLSSHAPTVFFEHDPRMLADVGESDVDVFPTLNRLGYSQLLFYDNLGWLQETVDASDTNRLRELMTRARNKCQYYYDICAIHDSRRRFRAEFLAQERRFFASSAQPA
jgi:FkbM family methyltransferase